MRWRIRIQMINTDNLVVRPRRQPSSIRTKPHCMDGATVIAHMAQLPGLVVIRVGRVPDRVHTPNAHMAVARSGGEARAIRRDVAGVDLEVLLFACARYISISLVLCGPEMECDWVGRRGRVEEAIHTTVRQPGGSDKMHGRRSVEESYTHSYVESKMPM